MQKQSGPLYAQIVEVAVGRDACLLGKQPVEVLPAQTRRGSHVLNGQILGQMVLHEGDDPVHISLHRSLPVGPAKDVAMKRMCEPEEVADLMAFLAGGRAEYITGVTVTIAGGKTLI